VFVTKDINLRLRADAIGLRAVNYEEENAVSVEEMYSGRKDIEVPGELVDRFYAEGGLEPDGFDVLPNQFVTLIDQTNPKHAALGRFHKSKGRIMPLAGEREEMWGIAARNREQAFAIDLLLDDSIQVVTLSGKAGTGKTLLAIAAGMRKVADDQVYSKLTVSRPIMPLGKELGFLPGEVHEKFRPWMEPVFDNLDFILNTKFRRFRGRAEAGKQPKGASKGIDPNAPQGSTIREFMDMDILDVQPLTYIRGRSLPHQFLVIDEAQNLTHHEVKTIVTRAGEGTKVVLTGDPYQIDNPFLDSSTSGLTMVAERFKNESIAGHITLVKGERSPLAELASNLL
jgi:PhoH-like ATPase